MNKTEKAIELSLLLQQEKFEVRAVENMICFRHTMEIVRVTDGN